MVKGEFGGWKEVRPTVRREGDMARREHRNEMILSSPNGSFGTIGAMVLVLGGAYWKWLEGLDWRKKVSRSREDSLSN